jgi:hypothetical protein
MTLSGVTLEPVPLPRESWGDPGAQFLTDRVNEGVAHSAIPGSYGSEQHAFVCEPISAGPDCFDAARYRADVEPVLEWKASASDAGVE